jgi:metal transporter CNNM
MEGRRGGSASLAGLRPAVLGAGRLLSMGLASANAAPLSAAKEHPREELSTPLWIMWTASMALVLIGGVFAGLTIA